jgi:2-polyprenyl-3-methyl-5-hydroxy-6-metoxy-1,4-benzoquinol methylase
LFSYEWFFLENACDIIFKTAKGCENMRKLQAFFHHVKPRRILDVATGNGSFVHLVTRMYDDYEHILGVDTSKKGIDSANTSFENDRIHFLQKDVFDMVDEQFDVILLSNSLHHFDDLSKLFKQLESLLSPKGFIVINEMMNDHLSKAQKSHMKLHHFAAEIDRHLGKYHDETMTSKEILANIQAVTSKRVIDAWDLVYPVKQGTS